MVDISDIAKRTKNILNENHMEAKKKFGQNFLLDNEVLNKIIEAAEVTKEDFIIEIGPGLGALTEKLASNAGRVCAIEIDRALVSVLKKTLANYNNIDIINDDILKVDLQTLISNCGYENVKVVANLPYYITTPIIMSLLEEKIKIKSLTIMVQKEVGERLLAAPSHKEYGAITLAVKYYSEVSHVVDVPASSFYPSPNVDSCVINLKINEVPPVSVTDEKFMFRLIKAAFSQRRKTLINCINNLMSLNISKEELANYLTINQLDERIRGEALSLEQFAMLSNFLIQIP